MLFALPSWGALLQRESEGELRYYYSKAARPENGKNKRSSSSPPFRFFFLLFFFDDFMFAEEEKYHCEEARRAAGDEKCFSIFFSCFPSSCANIRHGDDWKVFWSELAVNLSVVPLTYLNAIGSSEHMRENGLREGKELWRSFINIVCASAHREPV